MLAYIWYFFLYGFLGWCSEVCYAAACEGKFVNRGFLNGPICPMYGVGVVLLVLCLKPIANHLLLLFICSMVLTTALEWVTGYLLEKLFHQKWWDYSDIPFNLGGYVCLKFSLLWGLACMVILKAIHPAVEVLVAHIPLPMSILLLSIFTAAIVCDLVFTLVSVRHLNLHLEQLDKVSALIRATSEELGEKMSETMLSLLNKQTDLQQHLKSGEKRLLSAFPDMRSTQYAVWLEKLKDFHFRHPQEKRKDDASHKM